jgi:RHS repeat-associated protein
VRTEQRLINSNRGYRNNNNSWGNGHEDFVSWLSLENLHEKRNRRAYTDNHGLTRQSDSLVSVNRDYVIDYTHEYSRDLMIFENGGYATKYVYGDGNHKLWQVISKDSVEHRGSNAFSNIALEQNRKVYFHQDRLGSVAYVTNERGQILQTLAYDDWGKLNASYAGLNAAGLENISRYTNHDYDSVLDKFYAKARMYDATNRRFVSKDPHWNPGNMIYGDGFSPDPDIHAIRQSTNLYAYVMNNPINNVDPDGERAYTFTVFEYVRNGRRERTIPTTNLGHTLLTNLERILDAQLKWRTHGNTEIRASLHAQANAARANIRNTSFATTIFGSTPPAYVAAVSTVLRGGNTIQETERAIRLTADYFWAEAAREMTDVLGLFALAAAAGPHNVERIAMFNQAQCQPTNARAPNTANLAQIGSSFGKSGTLVNHPGTRVDWSKVSAHGLQRMSERGVTRNMVESWVRNGKALEQAGGAKHLFFTPQGAAVVATDGTVVTTIPASMYDAAYKALSISLFGF